MAHFVWYELVTRDVDAAIAFYGKLLGWQPREHPGGETRYVIMSAAGKDVAGIMPLPSGMPHPFWLGYIGTSEINDAAHRITQAGGVIHRAPWDIPGVGRIALAGDPQGVGFGLFQGMADGCSDAFNQALPGHGAWHQLNTPNPEAAIGFYAMQFGWRRGESMEGPGGAYHFIHDGDTRIGGVRASDAILPPSWLYYFGSPSITTSAANIQSGGGACLHEPMEVPGGARIVTARDPQGAVFALVGPA